MTKEEILAKSREENNNIDYAELEINRISVSVGVAGGLAICFILFVLKIITGQGMDYSLYAVIMATKGLSDIYKAFKTKAKKDIYTAVCWGLIAVLLFITAVLQVIMPVIKGQ